MKLTEALGGLRRGAIRGPASFLEYRREVEEIRRGLCEEALLVKELSDALDAELRKGYWKGCWRREGAEFEVSAKALCTAQELSGIASRERVVALRADVLSFLGPRTDNRFASMLDMARLVGEGVEAREEIMTLLEVLRHESAALAAEAIWNTPPTMHAPARKADPRGSA